VFKFGKVLSYFFALYTWMFVVTTGKFVYPMKQFYLNTLI